MINKIKSMILNLCEGHDWPWKEHIEAVVHYSKLLAEKTGADEEIVEVAAWLHDITKIKTGEKNHEVSSSEEAGKILEGFGYPADKIKKVKRCILAHPSDKEPAPETKEEKILFAADGLSHFDMFLAHARSSFVQRNLSVDEARERLIKKYGKFWRKVNIMPEAAEIAKPKYNAIKLILGED